MEKNSGSSVKSKKVRITYSRECDEKDPDLPNNSHGPSSSASHQSTNNSSNNNNNIIRNNIPITIQTISNTANQIPSLQIQQPTNPIITINNTNSSNLQLNANNSSSLMPENSLNLTMNRRISVSSNVSNSVPINNESFVACKQYPYDKDYEDIYDKYKKKVFLGRGGFGIVKLVKHKQTGQKRALKIIRKESFGQNDTQKVMKEIQIMMKMDHPHILKIYEYFEDSEHLYLITEHCTGGNLFEQIISKGAKFNEYQACKMMKQLMGAIKYAHAKGIVHRDIKPENILIDFIEEEVDSSLQTQIKPIENKNFIIKLIDWGLSTYFDKQSNKQLTDCCGTPYYIAPEVIGRQHDEKADIWSCGVVLYVLLSGSPPFEGVNTMEVINNIQACRYSLTKYDCWKQVHPSVKDLIKKMLRKDPNKRISAQQVLDHGWFDNFTSESQNNINTQSLEKSFTRLSQFTSTVKLQKAVIQFIASHLTPKYERAKLQELFLKLDTNNDGVLSQEEIVEGYQKLFDNREVCEIAIQQIMQKLDVDNDGTISQNEFIAGTMDIKNVINESNLKQAFQLFDKDNDGEITAQEIKDILGGEYDISQEQWDDIINEVDVDKDGKINFDEFETIMFKFANDSNVISSSQ